jgi:hypothetical protein
MIVGCEGTKKEVMKCLHRSTNKERLDTVQPTRQIRDCVKVE